MQPWWLQAGDTMLLVELRQSNALEKGKQQSDAIQQFLNDATALLEKPTRFGIDQQALRGAAQYAFGVAFEGKNASLEQMRRQISLRVQRYVEREQSSSTVVNHI